MTIYTSNIIPEMTSYNTPSGIASASSELDSTLTADGAFRKANSWVTTLRILTGWISYEFDAPKIVTKYAIKPQRNGGRRAPQNWTFEGSNEGTIWNVLDTRSNVVFDDTEGVLSFEFNNKVLYKIYRINITKNGGDTSYLAIGRLEMMSTIYNVKALFSKDSKHYSIAPPVYATETAVPTMTSNTTPSGRVFSSSEFSVNYQGWKAFDKVDNNEGFATANGSGGIGYLGYEFVDSIMIGKYVLRNGLISGNFLPRKWTFEGSNDGTNWDILDKQSNQVWTTSNTDKEYIIHANKLGNYTMYRLNWTEKNGINSSYAHLNELKLFEAKPSKWVTVSESTEQNFLKYGIDTAIDISQFKTILDIKTSSIAQDSGKTFEHTIDISKRRIDKIILR
nr:discoidin domain-containing protein [Paenibacillus xylanexedens]